MTDVLAVTPEESSDRLVLKLDPGGPVELADLTGSFAALARMYERHYRPGGADAPAPKLYVTKLETGSIVAEIVPYALILGTIISTMDSGMIVSDFSRRLWIGIKAFSDPTRVEPRGRPADEPETPRPSKDDAEDLKAFMRPLTGKRGANLGIRHARYERHDGERHTVAEYTFDEADLNRASVNIDQALASGDAAFLTDDSNPNGIETGGIVTEVMMFFEQASRKPGRESGRTGDRGIVPDISTKSLPVYFRKSFQNLKDQMVRSDLNPLTNHAFIVDVHVQRVGGVPKAYIVTNVHDVIELGDK